MWIERLARFGYATKGAVYILIGILAILAAFTTAGKKTDTTGALHTIAAQPLGQLLLILITVGFIGYTLWRFVQAIQDPDQKGTDPKGIVARGGYLIKGLIYGSLAFNAALLAMGSGGSNGGNSKQDWTALLLAQPFGQWLVGTIGAFVIGIGLYRIYKAYHTKFRKYLDLRELNLTQEKLIVNICRFGIIARGVIFIMLGFFLIQAARQFDPNEVRGLDGTLQTVAQQPFGKFLLAIFALGLVAYGIYMGVQARYRRIKTADTFAFVTEED